MKKGKIASIKVSISGERNLHSKRKKEKDSKGGMGTTKKRTTKKKLS